MKQKSEGKKQDVVSERINASLRAHQRAASEWDIHDVVAEALQVALQLQGDKDFILDNQNPNGAIHHRLSQRMSTLKTLLIGPET